MKTKVVEHCDNAIDQGGDEGLTDRYIVRILATIADGETSIFHLHNSWLKRIMPLLFGLQVRKSTQGG